MLTLPWPPSILSPNSRAHWAAKASAKAKYRHACKCLALGKANLRGSDGPIHIHLTFCPPDKRRRDEDNMIASAKQLLDGIAEAWGVDDHLFRLTHGVGPVVKHGEVRVIFAKEVQQEAHMGASV